MEDFIYYNDLYDLYGTLLTENEQACFIDYYQENLSLSEIAENKGISRSAISKTLKTVTEKLKYYEDNLHIKEKNEKLYKVLDDNDIEEIKNKIKKIIEE